MAILPRFVRRSLRLKIIAWSFVPTAIVLVAVALVLLYAYQRVTDDLVMERDWELTRLTAQQLGDELETNKDAVSGVAAALAGDEPITSERLRAAGGEALGVFDAGIAALDAEGALVAAEPETLRDALPTWVDAEQLRAMATLEEPGFTDALPASRGATVIAVTAPIALADGGARGAIVGLFRVGRVEASRFYGGIERGVRERANLPEGVVYEGRSGGGGAARGAPLGLAQLFETPRYARMRLSGEADTYIVDGRGCAIYHTQEAMIGSDLSGATAVDRVMAGQSGALHAQDAQGRSVLATYAPIPGTPWGLVTEESWAALLAPGLYYQRFLLVLLLLGVLAPAGVVLLGVNRIVRPIRHLALAADRVAAREVVPTISAPTGDELEKLARQFNRMAVELDTSYAHLESHVADRTRELSALNAIATEVGRSLDLPRVAASAVERSLDAVHASMGEVYRLEVAEQSLEWVGGHGLPEHGDAGRPRMPLEAFAIARPDGNWRPGVADMLQRPEEGWQELARAGLLRLMVSVPLMAQERLVGVMNLYTRSERQPTDDEMALLDAIGHQVGMAVENAYLHACARQLAVADERARLARDLHDSVTQTLYGVTLYAQAASRWLAAGSTERAAQHLDELQRGAQQALQEMRLLVYELRPPILEREGLAAALQTRLDSVEGRAGVRAGLRVQGAPVGLPAAVEQALYFVAQEALNNALRHAGARNVEVLLEYRRHRVVVAVRDDGVGFDPAAVGGRGGLGLPGMVERVEGFGGTIAIESAPGKGTRIRVEVPV